MSLSSVASQNRWVYSFETADGSRRDLPGGKGAELARMTSQGIPVPPGFTISTEACRAFFGGGEWPPAGLWAEVESGIHELERATGRGFGEPANALLVSVRSGAAVSMPGMMDTVLNLGINRQIVDGIVGTTGDERFALDLHRRFIQMYAGVVLGVDANLLSWVVNEEQRRRGLDRSADLEPSDLRDIIDALKATVADTAGTAIPDDPFVQLEHAVRAVFNSWNGRRAKAYRDFHGIPHDLGTAVSIVTMVYGNMDESSGTGVMFTRDPSTGEKRLFGEYLPNAQGEDVVSDMATPRDISYLATDMPEVFRELTGMAGSLEAHYRDLQDVEFF
jgi:pyruvate,orthophosphate dikinase